MVFNYSPFFFLVFHCCSEPNSEKLEEENGHFSLSLSVFAVYREQPKLSASSHFACPFILCYYFFLEGSEKRTGKKKSFQKLNFCITPIQYNLAFNCFNSHFSSNVLKIARSDTGDSRRSAQRFF